jgi:hypothetical protein
LGCCLVSGGLLGATDPSPPAVKNGHGIAYSNDRIPEGPWSIHVLKIDRARKDYEMHTVFGKGGALGLCTLTEQLKSLPSGLGQPLAAINGDFWSPGRHHEGDPLGLLITRGELVSGPVGHAAFWIDAEGNPRTTNVSADFKVTWPNGQSTPFGLNEDRPDSGAVLYTVAVGPSTGEKEGRELILVRNGTNDWLPLKVGRTYTARVKEVRGDGQTSVTPDTLVLSLGPSLMTTVPKVEPGALLTLSTATLPELTGVTTAIGGNPMLVENERAFAFKGSQPSHPRTAVGWNDKYIYFVEVDGRQRTLSVGMSLPELAKYLVKLGCKEAMNLDGGASSTFWLRGQVMNSPCAGRLRSMANALVLVQKSKPRNGGEGETPADEK